AVEADPLFRWGQVQFRPHLLFRFLYGDGLQSQPGNHAKSAIYELYPGLLMNLGEHWVLDYTPSLHFYSSSDFSDTLDHSVSLSGHTTYEDWSLGLSQGYSISSPLVTQTGSQTEQESFSTHLDASWQMTSKASLDLTLDQSLLFLGESTSETLSD